MATIMLRRDSACPGGGHQNITIIKNGVDWKQIVILTDELLSPPSIGDEQIADFVTLLVQFDRRKWMAENPDGTNAQYLAHLHAQEWEF